MDSTSRSHMRPTIESGNRKIGLLSVVPASVTDIDDEVVNKARTGTKNDGRIQMGLGRGGGGGWGR